MMEFNAEEFRSNFQYVALDKVHLDAAKLSFHRMSDNPTLQELIAYVLAEEIVNTLNSLEYSIKKLQELEKELQIVKEQVAYKQEYLKELEAHYTKERPTL